MIIMNKKIVFVTLLLLISAFSVEMVYAATVTKQYSGKLNTSYNYIYNGSASKFTAYGSSADKTGDCYTTVRNTSSSTVRASVAVEEYNTIAHVSSQVKANENNSLAADAIVATGLIKRHPSTSIFYYIHKGTVLNYQTGATLDSYEYKIIQ